MSEQPPGRWTIGTCQCGDRTAPGYQHCYKHLTADERARISAAGAQARQQIAAHTHEGIPAAMSPEGWYGNPDGSNSLRWWDGAQWTEIVTQNRTVTPTPARTPGRLTQWAEKAQRQVTFSNAVYLGGFAQVRSKKTGNLYFQDDYSGVGAFKPSAVQIANNMIASIEVTGGEVAKRKIAATVAFGAVGALAAKGAKMQTVVVIRTTDSAEGYFELQKVSPQEVRAKLAPWMSAHGIRWREDATAQTVAAPPPMASVADELQKLAGLRDSGVLSSQEFEAAKARLLGSG